MKEIPRIKEIIQEGSKTLKNRTHTIKESTMEEQILKKWEDELKSLREDIKRASENENRGTIDFLYPKMEQVTEFVEDLKKIVNDKKDDTIKRCWDCKRPMQFYFNNLPVLHCECGAEDPYKEN